MKGYKKNKQNNNKKTLDPMSSVKVIGYKINIQKLIVFLCTSNAQMKIKF